MVYPRKIPAVELVKVPTNEQPRGGWQCREYGAVVDAFLVLANFGLLPSHSGGLLALLLLLLLNERAED